MRHPEREARRREEEQLLSPLLEIAHRAGGPDGALPAEAKARFLTALSARTARPVARFRLRLALVAALAAAVAALSLAWPRSRLHYVIEGGAVAVGGFVAPARGEPATLRFSDGSTVALAGGARARVAEVSGRGARVVLEDGDADVRVVHTPRAAWSIEAGPFSVEVTGTAFGVGFRAAEQVLEVRMREGAVLVRGPGAQAGVALVAGQRLVAGGADGMLRIEADVAPPGTAEPGAPTSAPSAGPLPVEPRALPPPRPAAPPAVASGGASAAPIATGDPSASSAPASPPPATWAQRVARGDFAGVIADAEAQGIDAALAGVGLADLAALADAARYSGKTDLARRALAAERARFPGSREASRATFLLGRIADDAQGSPAAAVALYDEYLAAAPGGAFAEEALGRKMVALRRSGGRAAARGVAAEYLRRYPGGAFAAAARELGQEP
jgi:hypothetical protein